MVNYREILRLHGLNYSQREICSCVHSSRSTVQEVLSLSAALKISWPLEAETTNAVLEGLLYPERAQKHSDRMLPDFPKIHKELARKGVTLSLLWTEYCAEAIAAGKTPYMSTQFTDLYHKWARVSKATMRIQRKPGDTFEVDWAGRTLDIYDRITGDTAPVYLFVGALSCSGLIYAEACSDTKEENFINCHIHAYTYFGGVTRLLVPDNLRTGVTRNTRYETVIPRAYSEMAEYYGTAIVPARIKSPDDKPNAEGSVKFATTWILAALRNHHFFSLSEAREAVAQKLEELNDRPFQKRIGSRRSAYEEEEREFMRSLPLVPFEPALWATARIQNDYCVSDGRNRYSVPFDLIGEQVDVRMTEDTVEVFFHGNRVASHVRRLRAQRDAIILPEHMPETHRRYLSYNQDAFLSWAEQNGEATFKTIQHFLTEAKEPEQGYKYCVGLMKATDRYGQTRVEAACSRVLTFTSNPALRSIMTVLKNGQDKVSIGNGPEDPVNPPAKRSQGITRGADAFRKGGANA